MAVRIGPWAGRKYFLDKMDLRELVQAYFTHYAIMAYLALSVVSIGATLAWAEGLTRPLIAAALVLPVYPAVWYLLHRFVLHGRFLYRRRQTAALWKRVHFDHHQDPDDLSVLFGALYTTLPTIAAVTLSIGWLIGGAPGAAAALASGLLTTCFYEFCHCIQHLPFKPRWAWLAKIKKHHLAHHFHSERGNYGITNFALDRLLGTFYQHPREIVRSQTVFNLGYTLEEAERYPWVANLTEDRTAPGALRPARNR